MDIWLVSDTHFFHENILSFKDEEGELIRGSIFSSVEEMNEALVENWNSVVKKGDKVYHLGDVFFGDKEQFKKLWKRLNGKKNLILGNHDDAKFFIKNELVAKVQMWRMFPEYNLLLTHAPIHDSSLYRLKNDMPMLNVHGHIHQRPSPTINHKCVSVEQTNYTPVNIDELRIKDYYF